MRMDVIGGGGFKIVDNCDQCKNKTELFTCSTEHAYLCNECIGNVKPVILSKREAATVLAALRYLKWDDLGLRFDPTESYPELFADPKPVTVKEVDQLCEKINLS